ncbi:hypothetical protein B0H14DRAFT_3473048 [Mycena olivaceomarginata]|nr:hypothetical protein B0H14DRAFT_3473048 [Mycena olivaceomarginata]
MLLNRLLSVAAPPRVSWADLRPGDSHQGSRAVVYARGFEDNRDVVSVSSVYSVDGHVDVHASIASSLATVSASPSFHPHSRSNFHPDPDTLASAHLCPRPPSPPLPPPPGLVPVRPDNRCSSGTLSSTPSSSSPPATSASLPAGVPATLGPALPFAPPPLTLRSCVDRRCARRAWNVRLAVAFEKTGRRYRSSSAWNHFPSSPTAAPVPSPAAPLFCARGGGSTSPSESYSDDAEENACPIGDTAYPHTFWLKIFVVPHEK